jgi:hypothetical protein
MSLRHLAAATIVLAHLVLAGCATGRSVVTAGIDAGANPAQGTAVRIDAVEDARAFTVSPPSPAMPSLMGNEIGDKSVTSRAVGRKRGGFGAALGDVLLPEGTSVAALVQSAVARGLRESGYRVLERGDPGYERAVPIKLRVEQFWSWFNPGFAAVTLTNRAAVNLQGAITPLAQGRTFSSQAVNTMQVVVESDWVAIVNKGLDALATAVKDGVR